MYDECSGMMYTLSQYEWELDDNSLIVDDCMVSHSNGKNEDIVMDMLGFVLKPFGNAFSVARTLIRLGYEPLQPTRFHSPMALLGWTNPIYVYPNLITYIGHLMQSIGVFTILTTGVFASISIDFIHAVFRATLRCRTLVWTQIDTPYDGHRRKIDQILEECSLTSFCGRMMEVLTLKAWEVVISHPFYVIKVRQIGALVGSESNYAWFPSAVTTIYHENGLGGFFKGLVPRLIGELVFVSSLFCVCRLVRHILFGTEMRQNTYMSPFRSLLYMVLSGSVYPFEVTSSVMSVNGSSLAIAGESNLFSNWQQCRRYLGLYDQISRGYLPFIRSYVRREHIPIDN